MFAAAEDVSQFDVPLQIFGLHQVILLIHFITYLCIISRAHITCAAQSGTKRFYEPVALQLLLQLIIGHISQVKK